MYSMPNRNMGIDDNNLDMARWVIFAYFSIFLSLHLYAIFRQYWLYRRNKQPPKEIEELVSHEAYAHHRLHTLEQLRFNALFTLISSLAIYALLLFYGLFARLWSFSWRFCILTFDRENELLVSIVFLWLIDFFAVPINLLSDYFEDFHINNKYYREETEHKRGYGNKATFGSFAWKIVKCLLTLCILAPLCTALLVGLIHLLGTGAILWVTIFLLANISFVACIFFMDLFIPCLSSQRLSLHHCELRQNIEKICNDENISIGDIFLTKKVSSIVDLQQVGFCGLGKKCVLIEEMFLDENLVKEAYSFNGMKYEEEEAGAGEMEEANKNEDGGEDEKKGKKKGADEENKEEQGKLFVADDGEKEHMVENGLKPTTGGKIADEDIELNEAEIVAYFASGIEFFKERMTFKGNLQRIFPYLVLELAIVLLFQLTNCLGQWLFPAFHFIHHYPPPSIVVVLISCSLIWAPFQIGFGLLMSYKRSRKCALMAQSACRHGRGHAYRSALFKLEKDIVYGLGDWLFCIFYPDYASGESMATDLKELDKLMVAEENGKGDLKVKMIG